MSLTGPDLSVVVIRALAAQEVRNRIEIVQGFQGSPGWR